MSRKSSCPICTSSKLYDFLQRKAVPVHQNLVFSLREDALKVKNGELVFLYVGNAGLYLIGHLIPSYLVMERLTIIHSRVPLISKATCISLQKIYLKSKVCVTAASSKLAVVGESFCGH